MRSEKKEQNTTSWGNRGDHSGEESGVKKKGRFIKMRKKRGKGNGGKGNRNTGTFVKCSVLVGPINRQLNGKLGTGVNILAEGEGLYHRNLFCNGEEKIMALISGE